MTPLMCRMGRSVRLQCSRVVVDAGAVGDGGGGDHHFLERANYLVDASVRAGNESERAQHQCNAVHHQSPAEHAVAVAAVVGAGNRHMAQRREYQRQERAGHGTHHRYEQAQVRYQVCRDDCNTRNNAHILCYYNNVQPNLCCYLLAGLGNSNKYIVFLVKSYRTSKVRYTFISHFPNVVYI